MVSTGAQVRPPSLETSVPLRPTATSFSPWVSGTNATADRKPAGDVALSTTVHVAPPSEVRARFRPRRFGYR